MAYLPKTFFVVLVYSPLVNLASSELYRSHHILELPVHIICRLLPTLYYYIVATKLFLSTILFLITHLVCLLLYDFYMEFTIVSPKNKAYHKPTSRFSYRPVLPTPFQFCFTLFIIKSTGTKTIILIHIIY